MIDEPPDKVSKLVTATLEGIAEIIQALVGLFVICLMAFCIFYWGIGDGLQSGEREGTVEYADCREKIPLSKNQESFSKLYQSFTCQYEKTAKGHILGGECVHIDYEKAQGCKVAYIYSPSPDKVCRDPKFPILGADDRCYSN